MPSNAPPPPSVLALLANRVTQLLLIRDASGDVGFRIGGKLVRLERWAFQRQLTEALEKAATGTHYWGEYSEGDHP